GIFTLIGNNNPPVLVLNNGVRIAKAHPFWQLRPIVINCIKMIIGVENYCYAVDHNWAKLPEGVGFGYTHAIVEDKNGRIIIANQSEDAIIFFDKAGNYLQSWGAAYAGGAHGLTIHEEDGVEYLYLANTGLGEVVKTDLEGEVIWRIGTPDLPNIYDAERPFSPTETAVSPDNILYVTDGYGQHWVHRYDLNGRYLDSFGGAGSEAGQFSCPHGISIDTRNGQPVVQIANRANIRVDNFTLDGRFLETAINGNSLRYPCTTVHQGDHLYIPDLYGRISIFDADNQLVCHLGDYVAGGEWADDWGSFGEKVPGLKGYPNLAEEWKLNGRFSSPHGLHVDSDGNIYVAEWINIGRVTKLTRL
ncbi:MAG: hypothetical protein AAF614_13385, partial [Chloroflexota bacterium]